MPASKEYMECITNPWGESACIADEFSMPTAAVEIRAVHTVTSSDNGAACLILQPWDLLNQFVQFGVFTTSTSTLALYGQALHPDSITLNLYYRMYRTVSVGIKSFALQLSKLQQV